MKCENCGAEHDGSYGSGRFCSSKCSRGFSTKAKRKEINEKVSKSLKGNIPWHKGIKKPYSEECNKKRSESISSYFKENPGEASRRLKNHSVSDIAKQKISLSNKGKTGGYRERGGRGKQGWYKDIYCNSSWELAYVIYCKDHGISIERNKKGFEYIFENNKLKFYPDFIVNGEYVEIKGYLDFKNSEKINQFKEKIILVDNKSIIPYLEYVILTYGKNFTELYDKI